MIRINKINELRDKVKTKFQIVLADSLIFYRILYMSKPGSHVVPGRSYANVNM